MRLPYDPRYVAAYYDHLGAREWDRHEATWADRFAFAVHRHYLGLFVHRGDHVLEADAGPGRFTIELARLGARVHVGDVSARQLELNAERVRDAGCATAVVARQRLDICDLSSLPSASFDTVVCYGGALSYVMDQADQALGELLRVTKPGGYLLLSVMSLLGGIRAFLPGILATGRRLGADSNEAVLATGDLPREVNGHECHLFRWRELATLLARHGEIVVASATNFVSVQNHQALEDAPDEQRAQVLGWELELCREPGALDAGTHILAVVRKP